MMEAGVLAGIVLVGGLVFWLWRLVDKLEEKDVEDEKQDALYEAYLQKVEQERERVRQKVLTPEGKNELLKEGKKDGI